MVFKPISSEPVDFAPISDIPEQNIQSTDFAPANLFEGTDKYLKAGLPVLGGSLAAFAGPEAIPAGAMAGEALYQGYHRMLGGGQEKPLLADPGKDAYLNDIIGTGILTYAGGKVIDVASPLLKAGITPVKQAVKSVKNSKIINNEVMNSFFSKIDDVANKFNGLTNEDVALIANKISVTEGIPEQATKTLLMNGRKEGRRIWNDYGKDPTKVGLSKPVVNDLMNTQKLSFEDLNNKWLAEDGISEALKKSRTLTNQEVAGIKSNFINAISPDFEVVVNGSGKLISIKPKASVNADEAKVLTKLYSELNSREFAGPVNGEKLHEIKQYVNKVMNNRTIKDSPNATKDLGQFHKTLRDKTDELVPGYKDTTNKYAEMYKVLEDSGISNKTATPQKIEGMVKNYMSNTTSDEQRLFMDRFFNSSEKLSKVWKQAKEEEAAQYFRSQYTTKGTEAGFRAFGGIGVAHKIGGVTPYRRAEKLVQEPFALTKRTVSGIVKSSLPTMTGQISKDVVTGQYGKEDSYGGIYVDILKAVKNAPETMSKVSSALRKTKI